MSFHRADALDVQLVVKDRKYAEELPNLGMVAELERVLSAVPPPGADIVATALKLLARCCDDKGTVSLLA